MSATAEHATSSAAPPEGKTTTMASLKTQPNNETNLPDIAAGFNSSRAFALLCRAAKALADSTMVPKIYQNNLPNCIISLEMAQRIGASPLMVMQNLYIVHGRPGWSAKFLIACFNECGRFSSVRYIWSGTKGKDDWGCTAWAVEKSTGEKILGPEITMKLVKEEGWYNRDGSKWKTMPEKMFMYRAAAWMIDTTAPELSMGIRTDDEEREAFDATRGADGAYSVTTESLRETERQISSQSSTTGKDIPTWVATLSGQTSSEALEATWKKCNEAFGGNPPNECDSVYQNCREALLEKEGKQLEL